MWSNLVTTLTIWALKSKRLSGVQKTRVTNELLKNINAVPIHEIITYDQQGSLVIQGRKLEFEQAQALLMNMEALKNNNARKLIREQVAFEAIKLGLHQGETPEKILFAKAALWYAEQEQKLIDSLVQ